MLSRPHAILFDMDGTLTRPMLDFPRIKAEMGIGQRPILEALAEMDASARVAAEAVLHRHEEEAAATSELNPGCHELLALLDESGIARALITRNSLASVRTVLARHELRFEVLVTREDGRFKPDPAPLRDACRRLSVDCASVWMVGDGQYDIEAGAAVGATTVWLSHGRSRAFAAEPAAQVADVFQLTDLLRSCLA